jgi:hypothetical protein
MSFRTTDERGLNVKCIRSGVIENGQGGGFRPAANKA